MEAFVSLLVQIIAGGVGGNIAALLAKKTDLGAAANSIVGVIGGMCLTWIVGFLPGLDALVGAAADTTAGLNAGALIGQAIVGLIGGGGLAAIAGLIKSGMAKV